MIAKRPAGLVSELYRPLLNELDETLLTSAEVAAHWRYADSYLHASRKAGKGPPWIKLPLGAVRYRMSDIIAAQLNGDGGALTLQKIALAVSSAPISDADKIAVLNHLRKAFPGEG